MELGKPVGNAVAIEGLLVLDDRAITLTDAS
jgi:hypothetical protein